MPLKVSISIPFTATETRTTPSKQEAKKSDKPQRTPLIKSNVVSQISNAIGKHTSGLSNDVLSKFASRTRNRPKDDIITQLEEVGFVLKGVYVKSYQAIRFLHCTSE